MPVLMIWFLFMQTRLAHGSPPQATVALAVGDQVMMPAPASNKITVGNGKLIKVEDLGSRVRVIGKSKGETWLSIGEEKFEVHVLSNEKLASFKELKAVTEDMLGLQVSLESDQVQVTGELLRFQDWLELKRKLAGRAAFQFSAQLSDSLQLQAVKYFTSYLQSLDLPAAVLHFQPTTVADIADSLKNLEGKYKSALAPFGIAVERLTNLVSPEPMIRVKIIVAELKRKSLLGIGLRWPDSISARLINPPSGSLQVDPPEWTLQAIEARGLGKVLASPNLLCRSGKQAEFLAGGEIPIKIISHFTGDVTWKKYGVLLRIQPQADFAGHMSVGLETEVSMIDPSQTVDGIPGFLTNRIQSHFDLKESRTIALSGLIKREWSSAIAGLPGLNHIPILGALFSSQDYQNQQSELVVFVTPEVVSDSGDSIKMPEGWDHER